LFCVVAPLLCPVGSAPLQARWAAKSTDATQLTLSHVVPPRATGCMVSCRQRTLAGEVGSSTMPHRVTTANTLTTASTIQQLSCNMCVLCCVLQAAHHRWRGGQQHDAAQGQPHRL
jgi:hypothetical protein